MSTDKHNQLAGDADRIIDELGGTVAVAELCNISSGAVSQWRDAGIPEPRMQFFRVLRKDLAKKWPMQPSEKKAA